MEDFGLSNIEHVWIEERKKEDLYDISDDFYEKCANFAGKLRREIRESEGLRQDVLEREFEHVLEFVNDIYSVRVLKLTSFSVEEENTLLEEEKESFDSVKSEFEDLRKDLVEPVMEGELDLSKPEDYSNMLIILKEDITEPIIASDMSVYGPFEEGDLAYMPKRSAELFIGQGLARGILLNRSI